MSQIPRHVVKLGGSLLECDDLVSRLRRWLAAQIPAERLLIVGGGDLAESIRRADQVHLLGETTSHWLSVRTMQIHAEMFAALLPEARWCGAVRHLTNESPHAGLTIVDPWNFVHDEEPDWSPSPLPASWDVTSDSIAARLASLTGAVELTLLKSTLPDEQSSWENLAQQGYVDRFFPQAVKEAIRVRLVNLRDERFADRVCGGLEDGR